MNYSDQIQIEAEARQSNIVYCEACGRGSDLVDMEVLKNFDYVCVDCLYGYDGRLYDTEELTCFM